MGGPSERSAGSVGDEAVGGEPAEDRARRQIRGSGLLLSGQVFSVAVNLLVQVLIVRYLAKADFGAFAFALSIVAIAQTVAAFGLRHGVSRFMPVYEERGDQGRAAGTLAFALGTVLFVGGVVVAAVIALREQIAGGLDSADAVSLVAIMVALAPLFALGTVLDAVFAVYDRPRAIVFRRFLLVPALRLALVGLLILGGAGVITFAWGYLVVEVIGIAAYAPLLIPLLRSKGVLPHLRPNRLQLPVRKVLGFTAPLLTNDVTTASLTAGGAIVLGLLAGAGDVASLRAVLPVAMTMGYVLTSFGTLLLPHASRLFAQGEAAQLNRLYWHTATWTTVLAYPVFAVCVLLSEPVTEMLFGDRYASSASVLAVLALGQFVNTAAGHNGVLLSVFGKVGVIAVVNVAALGISLGLTFALVPDHGALGAAIAIAAGYVFMNLVRQVALTRYTTVSTLEPSYVNAVGTATAATAAALAIELILSPPLAISITLTVVACAVVFAVVHRHLRLRDTFPELARLPLVGPWLHRGA